MKITLVDTTRINENVNRVQVDYDMVSINLDGIDYYIYTSPDNRKRLALDTYREGITYKNEVTLYNGLIPIKRSLLDNLKNFLITSKTVIYNTFTSKGRREIATIKKRLANL